MAIDKSKQSRMINIELFPTKNLMDSHEFDRTMIMVNGILDEQSTLEINFDEDSTPVSADETIARFYNDKVISELLKYTIFDIQAHFKAVFCNFVFEWLLGGATIFFNTKVNTSETLIIELRLSIDYENWNKAWSISEFRNAFEHNFRLLKRDDLRLNINSLGFVWDDITLNFNDLDSKVPLEVHVNACIKEVHRLVVQSNKFLIENINKDNLVTFFDFPEVIRTSCKQYLIYFVQFLSDLEFEADAELMDQGGKTIFKVIPKDSSEALFNIQQALQTYLQAPGNPNFDSQTASNDIAVLQWQANVLHLKSQLVLSAAVLQAKEATIESLQLTNYQNRQLINNHMAKNSDKEEIIKGILSVGKFEKWGVSIDIAEIVRRLKRIR